MHCKLLMQVFSLFKCNTVKYHLTDPVANILIGMNKMEYAYNFEV